MSILRHWFLDSRTGAYLHLQDGAFASKGLLNNTMNILRGGVKITDSSIEQHGQIASTMMGDPPGFTTPLTGLPLKYKLNGNKLTLTDHAGKSVTLTDFPPIPATAKQLGKTHTTTSEGSYSDYYLLHLPSKKLYPCEVRPDAQDFASGSGRKLAIRGEDALKVLAGQEGAVPLNAIDRAAHEKLVGKAWQSVSVPEGDDHGLEVGDKVWNGHTDVVTIPPGWGSTELHVPTFANGSDKVVFISRGMAPTNVLQHYVPA
jgi:hypothetical protein